MSTAPVQRTSDTISRPFEEELTRLGDKGVRIWEPAEVLDYLGRYPDMAGLLSVMYDEVRKQFGHEIEVFLKVYHDPEIPDEYLALYVRQSAYEASFMDRIHATSARFEEQLSTCSGWLLLTSDFRKPGHENGGI